MKIVFHDPRLSSVTGGGEVLTFRTILSLDPNRFKIAIVTRAGARSPLFEKFLSKCGGVEVVSVEPVPIESNDLTARLRHEGIPGTVLEEAIVEDAIRFNLASADFYRSIRCDLLSVSVLPDLFCLDFAGRTVLHVYGCPPPEQAPSQISLLKRVSSISAVSHYIEAEFVRLFPEAVRRDDIEVIPPSLDPVFFQPPSTKPKDIDFLFAGRLRPRKGVDLILKAISTLRDEGVRMPRICVIGDGPERANLKNLSETLGLFESVRFVDPVNSEELVRWIDRSKWFLYPVRRPEAFGLAPLEAMARGVPAVVGALGGMGEYLVDGWNGVALHDVSEQALADVMRNVLENEEQRITFAAHAMETARRFSWESFADRINAFFAGGGMMTQPPTG